MKYLLLFFITFNVYAFTPQQCRYGAVKCGYKARNYKLFCKSLSAAQESCIQGEVDTMASARAAKKSFNDGLKATRQNLDCSGYTVATHERRQCELIKELAKRFLR